MAKTPQRRWITDIPMVTAPLQPLRVAPGWRIDYNEFREADLDTDSDPTAWQMRKEDMFHATQEKRGRILDLGWYPEQELDGCYRLVVLVGDFQAPLLHTFESRNRPSIVAEIERLMEAITAGAL